MRRRSRCLSPPARVSVGCEIGSLIGAGGMGEVYKARDKKSAPGERSLCGHIDLSPRGMGHWQPPFGIAGTVQNKATDATLAQRMSLVVAAGHSCGIGFEAAEHLKSHPEFAWQKPYLKDMPSRPWTVFEAAR